MVKVVWTDFCSYCYNFTWPADLIVLRSYGLKQEPAAQFPGLAGS
jgi:hypothetical protein